MLLGQHTTYLCQFHTKEGKGRICTAHTLLSSGGGGS